MTPGRVDAAAGSRYIEIPVALDATRATAPCPLRRRLHAAPRGRRRRQRGTARVADRLGRPARSAAVSRARCPRPQCTSARPRLMRARAGHQRLAGPVAVRDPRAARCRGLARRPRGRGDDTDAAREWLRVLGYPRCNWTRIAARADAGFDALCAAAARCDARARAALLPRCADRDDQKFLQLAFAFGRALAAQPRSRRARAGASHRARGLVRDRDPAGMVATELTRAADREQIRSRSGTTA